MTIRAGSRLGIKIPVRMEDDVMSVAGFARAADQIAGDAAAVVPDAPRGIIPRSSPKAEPLRRTWYGQLLLKTCAALVRSLASVETDGIEHLPAEGPAIIAGNHISLFDFVILGSALGARGRLPVTPTFIIADKWRWLARPYASQLGHTIYIRRGRGDVEALETAMEVLADGGTVAIMPEGRPTRGALTSGKSGVAYLAWRSGARVWPLAIFGHDQIFYFWKRMRRVPVKIRSGKGFILDSNGGPEGGYQQQADSIMKAIAALMPPEYHGVYSEATKAGR
jgi:1-acyl-sn-glycerol-3-phosphate acyltransferase